MTGKYPASIIDTVAAAIALAMDDTHLFVDDPRYPGKGLGAPHSEEYIEEVRAGAVAALDALGLTVEQVYSPLVGTLIEEAEAKWKREYERSESARRVALEGIPALIEEAVAEAVAEAVTAERERPVTDAEVEAATEALWLAGSGCAPTVRAALEAAAAIRASVTPPTTPTEEER